jgi:ankyrin repeat protein
MNPLANDLIMYARTGKVDQLRAMIKNVPNIDITGRFGWTALLHACTCRRVESAEILLDCGANVHWHDDDDTTALIVATCVDSPECVQLLLDRGADPHATDKDGLNAHQIAIKHGRNKVEAILAKAIGFVPEPRGNNPIMYDIDGILASNDFIMEIHNALYTAHEECNPDLLREEIQLFAIAAFHVDSGNGFSNIVTNENYEILLDALEARNVVQDTLLDRALGDIQSLLERYFIPRSVKGWTDCYATLENTNRLGSFKSDIEDLDRRYFEGSPSLWGDCDEYIERARQYASSKRDILSIRRGEQVGDGDAEEAV